MSPYAFTLFNQDFLWKIIFFVYALVFILLFNQVRKLRASVDVLIIIGMVVSVLALNSGKEMWYLLYFHPFIILGILRILKIATKENQYRKFSLICFAISTLILINGYLIINSYTNLNSASYDYHDLGRRIANNIPSDSKIFLSTIPDPYFTLSKNPDLKIFEFPPVPVAPERYKFMLDNVDYIVINFIPDAFLAAYIENNTENLIKITQPGGYSTNLIKLLPSEGRK